MEYTTLDWILYGSETNATLSTLAHLGLLTVGGYFAGKYVVVPMYESYKKGSKQAASANTERVIYQPQPVASALPAGPTVTYAG